MRAVDLFAGAGGFTVAAELAGAQVVWAANHWPEAVRTHEANHPETQHVCQDLRQADWTAVPAHDLLLASPACQGHSPARGKERPHHDATRATAFAIIDALDCHMPKAALIENVPAMMNWRLFNAWCGALNDLGYAVAPHVVDAADHGVPQHRERLMIVATRSKHPLQLHFDPKPHVPASSFIRFDQGDWTPVDRPGRAPSTLERVLNGRKSYGERFLMPYYGSGSGKTGRSLARPIGTITTRDRWAVVDGGRMRMLSKDENRAAMSFPTDYRLPAQHKLAVHMLGNAVPPLMAQDFIAAVAARI
ncbi:DNA cytosine methyltransferase (plasmid) [Dyella sp. BiH032]|uniref:DNA cytosine methyltransferase n=1 Tax=Dyella sp. BiH032 TaxID=3075430 RepID=UPI0028937105|nr:DNA cytosine methyltransferase [Dyella sp. BiH032]WNL48593.1 DNA cytosine methyltransferase [Dyella sp. BiH032]